MAEWEQEVIGVRSFAVLRMTSLGGGHGVRGLVTAFLPATRRGEPCLIASRQSGTEGKRRELAALQASALREAQYNSLVEFEFSGAIIEWRGPAPFLFVPLPEEVCAEIKAMASRLTYGWGCIPVSGRIGETTFTSSLFPKDGGYLLPVKVAVQRAEGLGLGDVARVWLEV